MTHAYLVDKGRTSLNMYLNNNRCMTLLKDLALKENGFVASLKRRSLSEPLTIDVRNGHKGLIVCSAGYERLENNANQDGLPEELESQSNVYIVPHYCSSEKGKSGLYYCWNSKNKVYEVSKSLNPEEGVSVKCMDVFNFDAPNRESSEVSKYVIECCKKLNLLDRNLNICCSAMFGKSIGIGEQGDIERQVIGVKKLQEKLLIAILSKADIFICSEQDKTVAEVALSGLKYSNIALREIGKNNGMKILYVSDTVDLKNQLNNLLQPTKAKPNHTHINQQNSAQRAMPIVASKL